MFCAQMPQGDKSEPLRLPDSTGPKTLAAVPARLAEKEIPKKWGVTQKELTSSWGAGGE